MNKDIAISGKSSWAEEIEARITELENKVLCTCEEEPHNCPLHAAENLSEAVSIMGMIKKPKPHTNCSVCNNHPSEDSRGKTECCSTCLTPFDRSGKCPNLSCPIGLAENTEREL